MDIQYGENQFYSIKQYILTEGKASGVKCIDLDLGDLIYTVIPDRGLDIGSAKYRGKQYAFLAPNNIVSPSYYDPDGLGWLSSFGGGLLVTCGLENAGEPCEYNGIRHGLHGKISNTPAELVSISKNKVQGEVQISIEGLVRETRLMGYNCELRRCIISTVGGNKIIINDTITNNSGVPQPLMLLYHLNFGYPLVSADTILRITDSETIEPFDDAARRGLENWDKFHTPVSGKPEEVFLHKIKKGSPGEFSLVSQNNNNKFGLHVKYSISSLPYLALWKSLRPGEYAAALEPCNNFIRGLKWESENGNLKILEPGEVEKTSIEFIFI